MTALKEFDRLESGGIWRETPEADAKDVTVSFGSATLVISETSGHAITHWSLPAVVRQNIGTRPAIFAPDIATTETLEIEDDLMIDAIEKVRKTLIKVRPKSGKLRGFTTFALVAGSIGLAALWLPSAFTQQTLNVVPQSKRAEIGATVLGHFQAATGTTCRGAIGTEALRKLNQRLLGRAARGQIVVVQELAQGAVTLPGGIILLDRRLIEQQDDVAVTAGYIVAAASDRQQFDPLAQILEAGGLQTTFTLFTTGDLPSGTLRDFAQSLAQMPATMHETDVLLTSFDDAELATSPYAQFRIMTEGDSTQLQQLILRDPMAGREMPLILSDSDWVRLQGICTP